MSEKKESGKKRNNGNKLKPELRAKKNEIELRNSMRLNAIQSDQKDQKHFLNHELNKESTVTQAKRPRFAKYGKKK